MGEKDKVEVYYREFKVKKMIPGVGTKEPAEEIYVSGPVPERISLRPGKAVYPTTKQVIHSVSSDWRSYHHVRVPSDLVTKVVEGIKGYKNPDFISGQRLSPEEEKSNELTEKNIQKLRRAIREEAFPGKYKKKSSGLSTQEA